MTDKRAILFTGGLAALSLSCAVVAPTLPLRISLPSAVLFSILLVLFRHQSEAALGLAAGYASFWLIGGVVVADAGARQFAALTGLLLGLSAWVPLVRTGLGAVRMKPHRMDFGVAGGVGFLGWMGAAMAAFRGRAAYVLDPSLMFLLGGGLVAWYAARGAAALGIGRRSRCAARLGLAILIGAQLAGLGAWATSTLLAQAHAARGHTMAALRWARLEEDWARRLGVRRATVAALRRQARIARDGGDPNVERRTLLAIVALAPDDFDAWQRLFRDALQRDDHQDAAEAFAHLPDARVDRAAAANMATICASERRFAGFLKAWRLCGGAIPREAEASVPWLDWGKRCYFAGPRDIAADLLTKGLALQGNDWEAVRMLWSVCRDAGDLAKAGALLEQDPASAPRRAEAAYLRAVIARRIADTAAERRLLQEALAVDPDYWAARQRTAEVTEPSPTAHAAADSVVIGGTLRLVDGRVLTPAVRIGDRAGLFFRWEALAPVDPSWKIFVHFRQRLYGGFFFQADPRSCGWGRAPEEWAIGTTWAREMAVPVPDTAPSGEYSVLIGVRDSTKALPVTAGPATGGPSRVQDGHVLVGRLTLLPAE